jgi:hypothetical protein
MRALECDHFSAASFAFSALSFGDSPRTLPMPVSPKKFSTTQARVAVGSTSVNGSASSMNPIPLTALD